MKYHLLILTVAVLSACGASDAYRASLVSCVENSPTRAAAERCKAALNDAAVVDSHVAAHFTDADAVKMSAEMKVLAGGAVEGGLGKDAGVKKDGR